MQKKYSICLLANLLIFSLISVGFPLIATAHVTQTITWLTHWTEPDEGFYWRNITKYYEDLYHVKVDMITVEFEALHDEINTRWIGGTDADMIHMHAMWLPEFANWKKPAIAEPPSTVQNAIKAAGVYRKVAVDGSTYKGIVWGFPTEFNSWTLVYNTKLFNDALTDQGGYSLTADDKTFLTHVLADLNSDTPLRWDLGATSELVRAAKLLTIWNTTATGRVVWKSGFSPFVEGMPEEQRYQFLSLLWSNGGDYLNLTKPAPLFNSTKGEDVMQLYYNLGFVYETYNPLAPIDYWGTAWRDQTLAMVIFPTWMTGVRNMMGENFQNLGISPIPVGPSGNPLKPVSAMYNWMTVVTQKAVEKGNDAACWNFLTWLNTAMSAGTIPMPADIGDVPRGHGCSVMGDYLIYDSIIPSKTDDQTKGRTFAAKPAGHNGTALVDDLWFKGFMDMGANYGHPDVSFVKATEVQYEIGTMYEKVISAGITPIHDVVQDAAKAVSKILPIAGDVNINGVVDIYDAVILIADWFATPGTADWNRGRSDCNDDNYSGLADALIIVDNYEKTWTP